jgi:hypothetical protein
MMASSRLAQALADKESPHSKSNEHKDANAPVAHPLLRLQRQLGNKAVSRLIAQREGAPEDEMMMKRDPAMAQRQEEAEMEEEELQAKRDPAMAQRQGTPEEEELAQTKRDPAMAQRQGAEEDEMMMKRDPAMAQRQEEEEMVAAKHDTAAPTIGLQGGPVGGDMEATINSKRGAGTPLESGLQQKMESSLNTSLADVRVHSDAQSDALNRSMTAKAFTTGSDIFLRKDVSQTDHSTMAHEVAHVVQQREMSGSGGGMTVGAADSTYEKEADQVAHAVNSSPGVHREIEQP